MRALTFCLSLILLGSIPGSGASDLDVFRQQQGRIASCAVGLARAAVTAHLRGQKRLPASPTPGIFKSRAAVFVTIAKRGQRRGCKGSFEPATGNLRDEIVKAAVGAATSDIRYRPIRSNELDDLTFTVSIVGPLKCIEDPSQYSPRDHGLLLRSSGKSGVILPGEAKTAHWQLEEAKRQAGIHSNESYNLYVFETVAFHEVKPAPRLRRVLRAEHN